MTAPIGAIMEEVSRRVALGVAPVGSRPERWAEYYATLLPQQRALCETLARWVAVPGPRRMGKSKTAEGLLLDAGERFPRTSVYYVHPGGGTLAVETLMGPDLNIAATAEAYGLPLRWNANTRTLYNAKTRTEIRLRGADDLKEVKKLRGHKMSRAVIDECQNFPPDILRRLVERDLGPSLMDCQGQLYLLGNVGDICRPGDAWYDITRNDTPESRAARDPLWEVHEWLALDNPHVREQAAKELGERLALLGGGEAAAITAKLLTGKGTDRDEVLKMAEALKAWAIVREHFGVWVHDAEGLIYRFDPARNTYDGTLPKGHVWAYFQGGDLGTSDSYADVVWAASKTHPVIYEVDSYKKSGLNADQWRERYDAQRKKWNPKRCHLDEGGLGRGIGDAWRASGIPVEAAEKAQKLAFVAIWNSRLEAGRIKVRSDSPLAAEWVALRAAPNARPGVYDVVGEDHVADAGLYGGRPALDYAGDVDAPAREETVEERRERLSIEALRRNLQRQQEMQRNLTSRLPGVRVGR
ncbi:MAG TPA: hypothetical protein VFY89_08940 [Ktedonobacterales bacterium]